MDLLSTHLVAPFPGVQTRTVLDTTRNGHISQIALAKHINPRSPYQYDRPRAYHTADDGQPANEQEEYQGYEDAYYGMNNLAVSHDDATEGHEEDEAASPDASNPDEDPIDVGHVHELSKLECRSCRLPFTSSNELHNQSRGRAQFRVVRTRQGLYTSFLHNRRLLSLTRD